MLSTSPFSNTIDEYGDLLFDLDNTLFPYQDFDYGAFNEIGYLFPDTKGLVQYLTSKKAEHGPFYKRLFNDAVDLYNLNDSAIDFMIETYRNHNASYVKINPHYKSIIEKLRLNGHRLFLVTNGLKSTQQNKISKLGIANLFTEICICDNSKEWPLKPDPSVFHYLDNKYNLVKPVMIGDTDSIDGEFARASNIPYIYHCYNEE